MLPQNETWVHIFNLLSRPDLCSLRFACRRFELVVREHLQDVCLRKMRSAQLSPSTNTHGLYLLEVEASVETLFKLESQIHDVIPALVLRLQSCNIENDLRILRCPITSYLVHQLSSIAHSLQVDTLSLISDRFTCDPDALTRMLKSILSMEKLWMEGQIAHHVSDEILRCLALRGLPDLYLDCGGLAGWSELPSVTEDGILHFIFNNASAVTCVRIKTVKFSNQFLRKLIQKALNYTRCGPSLRVEIQTVGRTLQLLPQEFEDNRVKNPEFMFVAYEFPSPRDWYIALSLMDPIEYSYYDFRVSFVRDNKVAIGVQSVADAAPSM